MVLAIVILLFVASNVLLDELYSVIDVRVGATDYDALGCIFEWYKGRTCSFER